MLKILELFSGTGSVGKCCESLGWETVSVDLLLPADHQIDIMDFDYKQYPKDYFDIIWASPPCTEYSNLKNCWIGRKNNKTGEILTKETLEEKRKESDKLILKTLEIINFFNPHYWFMENPQTGQLKNREVVKGLNYYDVDYCMYSDWGYKKRTRIWTNKKDWKNLLCDGSGSCGNMIDSKQHKKVLANGYEIIDGKKVVCNTKEKRDKLRKHKKNVANDVHSVGEKKKKVSFNNGTNQLDRYRIPEDLIFSLFLD